MYILLGYSLSSLLQAFSFELVFLANDPITFWILKFFIILYINRFIDLYTYIKIDFYIFSVAGFFSCTAFLVIFVFSPLVLFLYLYIFI